VRGRWNSITIVQNSQYVTHTLSKRLPTNKVTSTIRKKVRLTTSISGMSLNTPYLVGKIAEKAVCRKTHSFRLFFGDFAHWDGCKFLVTVL